MCSLSGRKRQRTLPRLRLRPTREVIGGRGVSLSSGLIEMPVRATQPLAAMNTEKLQGQAYGSDRTNLASYKRDALLYRITHTPSRLSLAVLESD